MSIRSVYRYRNVALADPISAAVWGFLFFLGLFLVAPIRIAQDYSMEGPVYLGLMYIFFFFGVFSYRLLARRRAWAVAGRNVPQNTFLFYRRLFLILFFFAILGEVTWLVDRFFFRSLSLDADMLERREAVESAGTTFFSIFSAVLSASSFLVWYLVLVMRQVGRVSRWMVIGGFFAFWMPALNTILFGSRSTLMVSVVYFFLLLAFFRKKKVGIGAVLALLLAFFGAVTFVVQAFLDRLEVMNMTAVTSIEESVYAFTLQPDYYLVRALGESQSDVWASVLFGVSNLAQYYCHGVFELFYQIDNFSGSTHSLGVTLFFVPYKFLSFVFPLPDVFQIMRDARPHYGAYGTFFGPVYSDFGWFGVVYVYFFGILSGWLHRVSWRNSACAPLYIFLVVTIFFFPVFNVFLVGVGFYLFCGFAAFALLLRKANLFAVFEKR